MRKIFEPGEWLENTDQKSIIPTEKNPEPNSRWQEVEEVIKQLESRKIDLTGNYKDWLDLGFAVSEEFGEKGREFFHRLSAMYDGYNRAETDSQYTNCLKSGKSGISLKTLFYKAKEAGVNINFRTKTEDTEKTISNANGVFPGEIPDDVSEPTAEPLPNFPEDIIPQLPDFLKRVVSVAASAEERDILLLGTVTVISGCLPKLYGLYDSRKVYPNLFLFVTAQASAGKGRLIHCRQIVNQIHKDLRDRAKELKQRYEIELAQYNAAKGKDANLEKPQKPPEKMLFIPANNSSTGAYQLLGDSEGRGIIFETEGDTLAQAFKSDYGNYSDGFRKAYHHETISYYRRTDREYVDIENPKLSVVLSGTPQQVSSLIPSAENGLFSRFIFYSMNVQLVWKNVFESKTADGLEAWFDDLGMEFYTLYNTLMKEPEIQFSFTMNQQQRFHTFFEGLQKKYVSVEGLHYMASVRRLGLSFFRLCMVFSVLRIMEHGNMTSQMICEDQDFNSVMAMLKVLVQHSANVYGQLPQEETKPTRKDKKAKFLADLPREFGRQQYLKVAEKYKIPGKTAEGYIAKFKKDGLLHHEGQDHYINLTFEKNEETKEVEDE